MKAAIRWVPLVTICWLLGLLAGCVHNPKNQENQENQEKRKEKEIVQANASITTNTMLEVDRHGQRYTNVLNKTALVDAHSTLVLEFSKPPPPPSTNRPVEGKWKQLHSVLEMLNEHAAEWQRLGEALTTLDRKNAAAVENMRNRLRALDKKANALLDDLANFGLSDDLVLDILQGRAEGITRPSTNKYLNVAQWATNHWQELKAKAQAYEERVFADKKVHITVQAFRESLFRNATLLHVENWDERPEGIYSPIDRTGLRPNEDEQKRLQAAREAANAVVSLVNSAKTNETKFKATLDKTILELKTALETLRTRVNNIARNWQTELPNEISQKLDEAIKGNDPGAAEAAKRLQQTLNVIRGDIIQFQKVVTQAFTIPQQLAPVDTVDPLNLLFGNARILDTVDQTITAIRSLPNQLTNWQQRLQMMPKDLEILKAKLTEDMHSFLSAQLGEVTKGFTNAFPAETEKVAQLFSMVTRNALGSAGAMEVLANTDNKAIVRTLENLMDARIDLKRSGLALGDTVSLRVRGTNAVGDRLINETYDHEVGFIGLHGKPAVHFIFARGLSGSDRATEWKPNVAAAVEWHYTFRDPKTSTARTWNWLDPAAGIHLASLDQTDENFELGAGGNISFWDGLLTGGFGFNFSAERPYVWVGVNLLSALNQAKGAFSQKQ